MNLQAFFIISATLLTSAAFAKEYQGSKFPDAAVNKEIAYRCDRSGGGVVLGKTLSSDGHHYKLYVRCKNESLIRLVDFVRLDSGLWYWPREGVLLEE